MPTPAEQAKQLGLVYLGFGGWGKKDDPNRKVIARTIDGHLVQADGDDDKEEAGENLGRLAVLNMDDDIIRQDPHNPTPAEANYIRLVKAILKSGSDLVILHARNSEKLVGQYLKKIGVTAGVQLVPYGSGTPEKKKKFVSRKIREGYTDIQYFDMDSSAINAIDSLKAPFNKLDVRIDTHKLPSLEQLKKTDTTPLMTKTAIEKRKQDERPASMAPADTKRPNR